MVSPTPPSALVKLPAELLVLIMGLLPAAGAAKMRIVSRTYLDLVDNPKHRRAIARDMESATRRRLQHVVDTQFTFSSTMSFLQALARFTGHRGFSPSREYRFRDSYSFAALWDRGFSNGPSPHRSNDVDVITLLSYAVEEAVDVHLRYHLPTLNTHKQLATKRSLKLHVNTFVGSFPMEVRTRYGWGEEVLRQWYGELRLTPGGCLQGAVRTERSEGRAGSDLPLWPLTQLPHIPGESSFSSRTGKHPAFSNVTAVVGRFGVPQLPDHVQLSYYVRSKWALKRVKEMLVGGHVLDPLVEAAVLEDMFIF